MTSKRPLGNSNRYTLITNRVSYKSECQSDVDVFERGSLSFDLPSVILNMSTRKIINTETPLGRRYGFKLQNILKQRIELGILKSIEHKPLI